MTKYAAPKAEFVDFEANDVIATSTCDYVCPESYGNGCTGLPYYGE